MLEERLEERNRERKREDNVLTEVVIPTVFTVVILFCLIQIGFSVSKPAFMNGNSSEKVTTISAFAS